MPYVHIHCPHCEYNDVAFCPALARRGRPVKCPNCGRHFPLGFGLKPKSRWFLNGLQAFYFSVFCFPAAFFLCLLLLFFVVALAMIGPVAGFSAFWGRITGRDLRSPHDPPTYMLLINSFWPLLSVVPVALPLIFAYEFVGSWLEWVPFIGELWVSSPLSFARLQVVMGTVGLVMALFYLMRVTSEKLAQIRELHQLVPAKARSIAIGLVELEGVLRIDPPAAGEVNPSWYLEDDTGQILIDREHHRPLLDLRLFDDLYENSWSLANGDFIYLLGYANENPRAPHGALGSARLAIGSQRESLWQSSFLRQPFRRQLTLCDAPGVFVLIHGGECHAVGLLRRRLILKAGACLVAAGMGAWLISTGLESLHG